MKISMKSLVTAGLIALSCTCSAFATPTVESLATEITQPGGFYTVYLGMPTSEYQANWSNVPGWTLLQPSKEAVEGEPFMPYHSDAFQRTYSVNGKDVKESFSVLTSKKHGIVFSFSDTIVSIDQHVIDEIFNEMYEKLKASYPDLRKAGPIPGAKPRLSYVKHFGNGNQFVKLSVFDYQKQIKDKGNTDYIMMHSVVVSHVMMVDLT